VHESTVFLIRRMNNRNLYNINITVLASLRQITVLRRVQHERATGRSERMRASEGRQYSRGVVSGANASCQEFMNIY